MEHSSSHLLSVILFTPLVGALLLLFIPRDSQVLHRLLGNLFGVLGFLVSLPLILHFPAGSGGYEFKESADWIPSIGAKYSLGADGISMLLVMLTTLLGMIAITSSWSAIQQRTKEYYVLLLLLQTGMLGVFLSLDFFLFYVFWEVMLVPMYFLIGVWGSERRLYAAIKFFLYTLAGSVIMLLAILALYFNYAKTLPQGAIGTFDIPTLLAAAQQFPDGLKIWLFWGFFFGFAIKVPMFPFHTWLPDAHTEAPTAGSIILAAVLLKMGTYGFVRFALPILPDATKQLIWPIAILAIIGIVYGALVTLVQKDMKKLIAYSSVSHLGFVMLGMFALNPMGIKGSVLQMINHGISTGALFLLVGIIYERRHSRLIADYGGLAKQMPMYATLFLIAALSSMGLPALNGFIGEFTILLGAANRNIWWAVAAAVGIVLGAAYLLWMYQRVFWGPLDNPENQHVKDLNRRELALGVALVAVMVWIGLFPSAIFDKIEEPVNYVVRKVDPGYFNPATIPAPPMQATPKVAERQ